VLTTCRSASRFWRTCPNTPKRFVEGATTLDGDLKRLMLDHPNFYATTGGHGACRGCGEVTAIRLVMATSHAVGEERRKAHLRELDDLLTPAGGQAGCPRRTTAPERRARIESIIATLERRLYLYEGGPDRQRPGAHGDRQRHRLQQRVRLDHAVQLLPRPVGEQPVPGHPAAGEGHLRGHLGPAGRTCARCGRPELELDDAYDPAVHDDELRMLSWEDFTPDELALLPTVMTIGGDGATYDIGFGALSRVLASDTPIKVLVLNSGAYSNTGGQASTSSFTGQDSDLARFGGAHHGKHESRKELGLLASFHPNVFACSTSTALHGHFLARPRCSCSTTRRPPSWTSTRRAAPSTGSPRRLRTPGRGSRWRAGCTRSSCTTRAAGATLHDWFSLDGNPDVDKTWTTSTLEYVDE
jgi:pyruvate-ferredoxin/flavodoxin oxidoreductase